VKPKWNIWLPALLVVTFAITRLPGLLPENFSAAYALVFCAGVYFPRKLAWWLPLSVLLATDVLLNLFYYHVAALDPYMLVNYAAYAALIGLGRCFSPTSSWSSVTGGGLLGALLFYLITNTAAWLQNPQYPKTFAGWIQAMTTGIPGWPPPWTFLRNTLLSGGLFTGLFCGAMKLSEAAEPAEEADEETEEEDQAPAEAPEEAKS
jgi:uncharacterized protein DUF6580